MLNCDFITGGNPHFLGVSARYGVEKFKKNYREAAVGSRKREV